MNLLGELLESLKLPSHLQTELRDYCIRHIRPRPFVRAVLENNLRSAVHYGNHDEMTQLELIIKFCLNVLPSDAWGSKARVEAWLMERVNR